MLDWTWDFFLFGIKIERDRGGSSMNDDEMDSPTNTMLSRPT